MAKEGEVDGAFVVGIGFEPTHGDPAISHNALVFVEQQFICSVPILGPMDLDRRRKIGDALAKGVGLCFGLVGEPHYAPDPRGKEVS